MNQNQIQQGDILLEKIDRLPAGMKLVKRSQNGAILAESKTTNNRHYILDRGVSLFRADDGSQCVVNENDSDALLQHSKDHKPLRVAPGVHKVMHVQERDHVAGMTAPALD